MKIEEYVLMNGTEQEILDLDLDTKTEKTLKQEGAYYGKVSSAADFAKLPLKIRQKVLNVEVVLVGWGRPAVKELSFAEQLTLAKIGHYTLFEAEMRTKNNYLCIYGPSTKLHALSCVFENYSNKVYKVAAGAFLAFSAIVFLKNLIEYVSAHL